MSLPAVAIIGRPNVGKSTLINRIAQKRSAIVHEQAGVTRDRNYITADWRGLEFTLIDTGGIQFEGTGIENAIAKQAEMAVEEADAIIFLVDRKTGILPDDNEIADKLRQSKKPVLLVVNKVDEPKIHETEVYAFYGLGIGDPISISADHGIGIGELLDKVVEILPEKKEVALEEEALNIAIVGRPNVGKSSLLNRLLGVERVIVSEVAGTTRDSIDSLIKFGERDYRFIDTAGIRRSSKKNENIEYYGFVRALKALDRANVALVVIDASSGITEGDQKVIAMALSRGCAIILLANKWDLLKGEGELQESFEQSIRHRLRFIQFAPLVKISAKTGYGLKGIFNLINEIYDEYNKHIKTSELNGFIEQLKAEDKISKINSRLKLYYGSQVKSAPPHFVFYVNDVRHITSNARAYFERLIRDKFVFLGSPIHLSFRKSK